MPRAYSNPERESETYALPDLELFELNAREVAERDEDLTREYLRRHEYRLAGMNSRTREKMFDAMIEEQGITGGWFYWYCFPGCMPEGDAIGPYATYAEALAAARDEALD